MISPPQSGQMNLCVATVVREFLLAPAILCLQSNIRSVIINKYVVYVKITIDTNPLI